MINFGLPASAKHTDPSQLNTALHLALLSRDPDLALTLIQQGADCLAPNAQKVTPLHMIMAFGYLPALKEAITKKNVEYAATAWKDVIRFKGIHASLSDIEDNNLIHYLAAYNPSNAVEMLNCLESNGIGTAIASNDSNKQQMTPFHAAASATKSHLLEKLLGKKNGFVVRDELGMEPIHRAIAAKERENTQKLAKYKHNLIRGIGRTPANQKIWADKKIDPLTMTPFVLAVETGMVDIAADLLSNQNELRILSSEKLTAVHLAIMQGRLDLLQKWFQRFSALSLNDPNGRSLLHVAAKHRQIAIVKWLQEKRFELGAADPEGNTCLHIAIENKDQPLIDHVIAEHQREKQLKAQWQENQKKAKTWGDTLRSFTPWADKSISLPAKPINLDAKNIHGETAYMLAEVHELDTVKTQLKDAGAKTVGLFDSMLRAIYGVFRNTPSAAKEAQKQQKRERTFAARAVKYRDLLCRQFDEYDNSVLHHCMMFAQPRYLKMLLHAMTPEQRKLLCEAKNKDGLTPAQLLEQMLKDQKYSSSNPSKYVEKIKDKLFSSAQLEMLAKCQRALRHYDPRVAETLSLKMQAKVAYQWNQDVQDDLVGTYYYNVVSKGSLIARPTVAFASTTATTGNPYLGVKAAVMAYFSGDIVDNTDRVLNLSVPYLARSLQKPAMTAQQIMKGVDWYINTSMRVGVEGVRQLTSFAIDKVPYDFSLNYLDDLEYKGLIFAASEEVFGRRVVGPYLEHHLGKGIEDLLNQRFHVPKTADMLNGALSGVNSGIEYLTGINLRKKGRALYEWVQESVGGIRRPIEHFKADYEAQISEAIATQDPTFIELCRAAAEHLFIEYYYDPSVIDKLNNFIRFIQHGTVDADTVAVVIEVATFWREKGVDAGAAIVSVLVGTPNYQGLQNDKERLDRLKQEWTKIVETQLGAKTETKVEDLQKSLEDIQNATFDVYLADFVATNVMAVFTTTDPVVLQQIEAGMLSYAKAHFEDPDFKDQLVAFVNFVNLGIINDKAIDTLGKIAVESQPDNPGGFVANVVLSTEFYTRFGLKPEQMSSLSQHFTQQANDIFASNEFNLERLDVVLNSVNFEVFNHCIDNTRNGAQVIEGYYKALNGIKPCPNGRAQEVGWQLVIENMWYFQGLSKAELESVVKVFQDRIEKLQGNHDHDLRAANNYNTFTNFLQCSLFVPSFLANQPLNEETRQRLAKMDPKEVRAAFAVHESLLMLSKTPGYKVPSLNDQISMYFAMIDAQYISNHGVEEKTIRGIIWNCLSESAVDKNNYAKLWGEHTLDQATSLVQNSSKLAGENHWSGTPDNLTRPIHPSEGNFFKRLFRSVQSDFKTYVSPHMSGGSGNYGLGFTTNGSTVSVGVVNTSTFTMMPASMTFGATPASSNSAKPITVSTTSMGGSGNTPAVAPESTASTEQKTTTVLPPFIAKPADLPQPQPKPISSYGEVLKVPAVLATSQPPVTKVTTRPAVQPTVPPPYPPIPSYRPQSDTPVVQSVPQPQKESVASQVGDFFVSAVFGSKAHATPLIIPAAAAAVAGGAALGAAILRPHQHENEWDDYTFPVEKDPNVTGSILPGGIVEPANDGLYRQPIPDPISSSSITRVDQPGFKEFLLMFPEIRVAATIYNNFINTNGCPVLFHSVTQESHAKGILKGIDPDFLKSNNRFGKGFYMSADQDTTFAELAHSQSTPTQTVSIAIDVKAAKILDLTDPKIAEKWGYKGGNTHYPDIGSAALKEGYNAIKFNSERGSGVNLVVLNDFEKVVQAYKVVDVPKPKP